MNHIGDPDYQTDHWELQQLPDNCAVVAQIGILSQFDIHITQADATYVALENGWYEAGFGTHIEDSGKIMEAFGVPVHHVDNASIFELAAELQKGHGVLVGVNSSELWQQGPEADFWNWVIEKFGFDTTEFDPADHAICVTGIDTSDPKHPEVIINDPGDPNGAGARYPLDRFVDAWENSGFHYVATDHAPPDSSIPTLDIGDFLGIGTTLAVAALTGDIITASQAGEFVDTLYSEVDWNQIMASI